MIDRGSTNTVLSDDVSSEFKSAITRLRGRLQKLLDLPPPDTCTSRDHPHFFLWAKAFFSRGLFAQSYDKRACKCLLARTVQVLRQRKYNGITKKWRTCTLTVDYIADG